MIPHELRTRPHSEHLGPQMGIMRFLTVKFTGGPKIHPADDQLSCDIKSRNEIDK